MEDGALNGTGGLGRVSVSPPSVVPDIYRGVGSRVGTEPQGKGGDIIGVLGPGWELIGLRLSCESCEAHYIR